jgi:hypothetical protein
MRADKNCQVISGSTSLVQQDEMPVKAQLRGRPFISWPPTDGLALLPVLTRSRRSRPGSNFSNTGRSNDCYVLAKLADDLVGDD